MRVRTRSVGGALALLAVCALVGTAMLNPPAVHAQKKYRFVFLIHAAGTDPWNAVVQKGMADAAAQLGVDATMLFSPQYDDAAAQVALLESTLLKKPDGIITTIIHPTMFNKALKKALDMGIPVIASNTDALLGTGDPLERRIPYIGSSLFPAGYDLARKAVEEYFSDKTSIRALVGIEAPGASWADLHAAGAIKYLEEKGIPYEKLDIGSSSWSMESRVSEYIRKNPATNLVISQGGAGPWGTAAGVRDAGKKPGDVIVVGYDVMPQTVQWIKDGYVSFVNDQHPYLQGYLPVVQLYLTKEFGMRTWSVDTGIGYVDKNSIDQVSTLVEKKVR